MANEPKDRRLAEAADLQKELDALYTMKRDERHSFLHDRIFNAVESCCAAANESRATFNKAQITALSELAFQIVYVIDARNKRARGFRKFLYEFNSLSAIAKLTTLVLLVGALYGFINGIIDLGKKGYGFYNQFSATAAPAPNWFLDHLQNPPK
jgi:hypothetical protein